MAAHPKPVSIRLADEASERVRQSHAKAIESIQDVPAVSSTVVPGVSLADGVLTPVAHRLGRTPVWCRESIVRGATSAGVITEDRTGKYDRSKVVALKASGFGATITFDLLVM